MLPFDLSETDLDAVKIERKSQSNIIIRDRMTVLWLLHLGFSRQECAKIVGCSSNSVTNYVRMYNDGGLGAIRQLNYGRAQHSLGDRLDEVKVMLIDTCCSSIQHARSVLEAKFNYEGGKEATRQLLHRLGFRKLKFDTFPGKIKNLDAWLAKQAAFIDKLEILEQQARNGQIDLCFSDASHFVYGKFSACGWLQGPLYMPSGHGRHRINVYGSFNAVSHQVFSMYNEGYIDAAFMVEYFEWLRSDCYTDQMVPLHLVLDNARYQHCELVKGVAQQLNIILEFLPAYSPNLNLIERLWKYFKGLIGRHHYETKEAFENAIVELLGAMGTPGHQAKLSTLMTMNFQTYEKSQIQGG